jgi:quercetin dioxygenase-like cupin family protein
MVFGLNEGLPEHLSNGNVYMTVVRGRLSIGLGDQEIREYEAGTLLKIPIHTKMNVKNLHSDTLELIVVKAPAPTG